MNIAIVSDSIYPFNKGGKEKRLHEFVRLYKKAGHSVTVFTMKWWHADSSVMEKDGVTYVAVCKKVDLYTEKNIRSFWQAFYFSMALFVPLFRFRKKCDLVDADQIPYFQLFVVKFALLFSSIPFFCTWHEVFGVAYWRKYAGYFRGSVAAFVEWMTARLPDRLVAVSARTQEELISKLGVRKEKVSVVENGIHFSYIQSLPPASERFDLLFAGRLLKHKNVGFLFDVLRVCEKEYGEKLTLGIIGDGPELSHLKARAEAMRLSDQVVFKGFLESHDEVYSYMKSAKVLAFPSSREGFGIVVLEAFAAGLPVVALDSSKNFSKELIVNGETGYVVSKDSQEYAAAIKKIIGSNRDFFSKKAIIFSKKYDWKDEAEKMLALYTQTL